MKIKSSDLPGVGKRIAFLTAEGKMMVLISHHSGKRELFFFEDPDDDEAQSNLVLTAEETRQIGAELLGAAHHVEASEQMMELRKAIVMEWLEVMPTSTLIHHSITECNIRSRTGASVVGIIRQDDVIPSPDGQEILLPGDTLLAIGKKSEVENLKSLCQGESST